MPGLLANKTVKEGEKEGESSKEGAVKDNNKLQLLHANC